MFLSSLMHSSLGSVSLRRRFN